MGAGLLAVIFLASCQSISEQAGKKLAEGMLSKAVGGDVKIDDNGGNVTVKTKDGEATYGSGDTRPASIPADMPNLPNAKGFTWMGSAQGGVYGFKIDSTDVKGECAKEEALVTQANWQERKDSFNMEAEDFKTNTYYKDGNMLTVSCTKDGDTSVQIMLSTGKDTSANAEEEKSPATESPVATEASEAASTEAAPE